MTRTTRERLYFARADESAVSGTKALMDTLEHVDQYARNGGIGYQKLWTEIKRVLWHSCKIASTLTITDFELLIKDLNHYKKNGYKVILLSGSKTRAARLAEDILNEGLNCFYTEDYDHELLPVTDYGLLWESTQRV